MARNVKPGITFYRMDSNHITNEKIRLLFNACDSDGYYIWQCLISYGYDNNGYYFDLNNKDKLELFATEYCKKDLKLISKVIKECIKRDLFNSDLANSYNILTSFMMQEVYFYATAERRKKGSVLSIPQKIWLLQPSDFPLLHDPFKGFIFNPDFTGFAANTPGRNPQTKTNTIDKDIKIFGPVPGQGEIKFDQSPKNTSGGGQDARRKKNEPIPPGSYKEVEDYFLLKKYNPKNPGTWFPDLCRREADKFWNFYEANGWVQANDQKPIQKWQAAANKWITNVKLNETTGGQAPAAEKVITPASQRTTPAKEIQLSINYLYERFIEDQASITILSIEIPVYEYLLQLKAFHFNDDEKKFLHTAATGELEKAKIDPTPELLKGYMKKFAVIELFKQYQAASKPKIFKI